MRILYRYIIKELLSPFLLILFVFTGLLFLTRSLKLIELITNKTASIFQVIYIFSLVIPQFLEMAIPMAFLLSIIIAMGRLSTDSEIIVMRSVGFSIKKLLYPLYYFSFFIFCLALIFSLVIRPFSNNELGNNLFKMATAQMSARLLSGTFNEIGPLTIYARESKNNGRLLEDVMISDKRNPEEQKLFFAQNAKFQSDEIKRSIRMELFDGSMQEGVGSNISHTNYSLNSITISEDEISSGSAELDRKKTSEMNTLELLENIRISKAELQNPENAKDKKKIFHLSRLRVELQKRLTLPASSLFVGILALALGIQPSRGGSRWGTTISFVSGILTILLYYASFAVSTAISEAQGAYIELIMWIPNTIFFIIGALLFKKIATEEWNSVVDNIGKPFKSLFKILTRRSHEISQ